METVNINGKLYTIEYRETKIGDRIYDKNTEGTYLADIADADDMNWIVTGKVDDKETINASKIEQVVSAYENLQVRIGRDWYYISFTDLTKILRKSRAKVKVVKKRVRTWIEPI